MYRDDMASALADHWGDPVKAGNNNHRGARNDVAHVPLKMERCFCIPEDQSRHLPRRWRAPACLPEGAPTPRVGEIIYLSASSAWAVALVVHEWKAHDTLRVELWLEHVSSSRYERPPGFALTQ